MEMTKECIENFNTNFSKGGQYEIYSKDIGYDENEPITQDDFVYGLDKIDVMIKRWSDVAAIEDINIDYATRRFGQ